MPELPVFTLQAPALPGRSDFQRTLQRGTTVLIVALVVPLLALLGLVFHLVHAVRWIEHTDLVIAQAHSVEKLVLNMETGRSGFLLTNDPQFLEPFEQGKALIDPQLAALSASVSEDAMQSKNAADLRDDIEAWRAFAAETGAPLAVQPADAARLLQGKALMDAVRARVDRLIQVESQLLAQRKETLDRLVIALFALLGIAALAGIPALTTWLHRLLRDSAAKYQAGLLAAEFRAEELRTTLHSIGDAVLATDGAGAIAYLNPEAERLTGWSDAEARGKAMAEVLPIFNEETGEPAPNPVQRVLRERIVIGLANHTVLRQRGGGDIPIEDSAAPIFHADGSVRGVILVFHDVTEKRAREQALLELSGLAKLRADVAVQFAAGADDLQEVCALIVEHLEAAFARIWTLDEAGAMLHLRASAGLYTHLDGPHARVPVGAFKIGRIAASRQPLLTNDVANDPNISDPAWAAREGMAAFAGYPLMAEGKLVGVLALFSRHALSEAVLGDLAPLAESIARSIERRDAETELRAAKERVEIASKAKDDFLAALSHELRTPLTPVLMSAAALREDERLPEDVREQLRMMERNIALEGRLIDDLLDVTRIAKGKLSLRPQPCDAHSLINLAVEIVRDDAQVKAIALERDFSARRSGLVADPARFQQVIWNLLRNAVKFTPRGGSIAIRTADDRSAEGTAELRIEVCDSGIGIAPSALDQIFLPFEQGASVGDHRFGGLGLGLSIARAIVELHGGEIRAESDGAECGATFIVTFPGAIEPPHGALDPIVPLLPTASSPAPAAGIAAPLRLLLVEDHEATLAVLKRLLARAGHHVHAASTITAALALAEEERFDAVISDLGLPDGTGMELMEKLRARHGLRGIALSGYGMEEDLARSREAGFATHLIKPVDFFQLQRALRDLMAGTA